jgi:serine/threonine protein kinase
VHACAQVFQVRARDSGAVYAMKVMRKERILAKDHGGYVKAERDVLTAVVHPYIVTLRCSFQARGPPGGLDLLLHFLEPFWTMLGPIFLVNSMRFVLMTFLDCCLQNSCQGGTQHECSPLASSALRPMFCVL